MTEHRLLVLALTTFAKVGGPYKPVYEAVHSRVNYHRGRASDYTCECGQPAEEWSYDHLDPHEVIGLTRDGHHAAYSLDIEHYVPRCRLCHRRFDGAHRRAQREAS